MAQQTGKENLRAALETEKRGWTARPRQEGIEVVKSAGFHS